jgi:hypothetical protein
MRADDPVGGPELEPDPEQRRRLIDALMAGPPAGLPSIVVVGDDDIFGIRPPPQPQPSQAA